jgi:hypothetical protein
MKKLFFLSFVIAIGFTSCTGYDEGPAISFTSTSKLLYGRWTVVQFLVDGVDSLQRYNDSCGCKISFENPSGDSPQYRTCIDITGKMSFDKKGITFNHYFLFIPFSSGKFWEFKRLSQDDCWMTSTINGKNYYVKLKY